MSTTSAAVWRAPEHDGIALVERVRWRVQLSDGPDRRRIVTSRRAAVEWCREHGVPFVLVDAPERA